MNIKNCQKLFLIAVNWFYYITRYCKNIFKVSIKEWLEMYEIYCEN